MSDNSTRSNQKNVRFNECVKITTIKSRGDMSTSSSLWYNAEDFSRFRTERRREIEAIKQNGGEGTHFIYRGNEQAVFQPSQLRIMSRAVFVRKVLDQQDYENMKTSADSRMEDRLATKVRRWSMAAADQAIMRAQLDIEPYQTNWQHPMHNSDSPALSLTCSESVKVVNEQICPFQLHRSSNQSSPVYTSKKSIAFTVHQSCKENTQPTFATGIQRLTMTMAYRTAKCA